MASNSDDRPAKRAKTSHDSEHGRPHKRRKDDRRSNGQQSPSDAAQQRSKGKMGYRKFSAAISSSGIHNDDVGIFVSSDMGQEKKCLRELEDLLGQVCALL
jgi:hypothetical protein